MSGACETRTLYRQLPTASPEVLTLKGVGTYSPTTLQLIVQVITVPKNQETQDFIAKVSPAGLNFEELLFFHFALSSLKAKNIHVSAHGASKEKIGAIETLFTETLFDSSCSVTINEISNKAQMIEKELI